MTRHKDETGATNAIEMLREDHKKVLELFEKFENARDKRTKQHTAETILSELDMHATLEEEIFYPAAREAIDDDDIMDEAEEEHHVAKGLMAEIEAMDVDDEHYDAKVKVLGENIEHHAKEEESEMFPKVKKSDLDLEELGAQMSERKQELLEGMGSPRALKPKGATRPSARGPGK